MKKTSYVLAAIAAAASLACASGTRIWSVGDRADFEKARLTGLALSSDGSIKLAPVLKELFDSDSAYLWALTRDSKGNLYAGGGGPGGPGARVYMITPQGKTTTLAALDGLEVHAIAVDAQDRVYAATSPNGKVYRIENGKSEVFYDPHATYIWALAFNSHGELFAATGDGGEVHRVTPDGKGSVFYKAPETHARSLALDEAGNLIVGTEPGGLIIRVNAKGEGFVLYQAAKPEITSVAVAGDGSIWAAAVGARQPGAPAQAALPLPVALPKPPAAPGAPQQPAVTPQVVPPAQPETPAPPSAVAGSEVYRIDRDGFPKRVWSHPRDVVYSIVFGNDQRPLLGTGNEGRVYRLDSDLVSTALVKAAPSQVTALYASRGGNVWAATGNIGKVYAVSPAPEKQGAIESEVFDAGVLSQWGRLQYRGSENGGRISIQTRSGNLDRTQSGWSPWSEPITGADGAVVTSPPARFLQWRATLSCGADGRSPVLEAVDVAYLPRNVAPVVSEIEITPPNYRFPVAAPALSQPQTISLPPLGNTAQRRAPAVKLPPAASMQFAKGFLGVRWSAADANDDSMTYAVYIRGEKEKEWKLLKDDLQDAQVSFDSTAFPDGEYRLKVVASDAPDNAPDIAAKGELVSRPFTIDNTPPEITGLSVARDGKKLVVAWSAHDALNVIDRAEYSINGGDWTLVEPVTRLSDSRDEQYKLIIERPDAGEVTVAVRVQDEFENRSVAKTVVQ